MEQITIEQFEAFADSLAPQELVALAFDAFERRTATIGANHNEQRVDIAGRDCEYWFRKELRNRIIRAQAIDRGEDPDAEPDAEPEPAKPTPAILSALF
jgi:hypothetical protein